MQYRLINEGEIVNAGDEWVYDDQWKSLGPQEYPVGYARSATMVMIRRPIEEPKAKACKVFGKESPEGAKFCQHCGKEFPKQQYRVLTEGEIIREGDEYYNINNHQWSSCKRDASPLSVCKTYPGCAEFAPVRRKITSYTE